MLALKFQVHAKEPVTYRVHISIKNKNLVIPVWTKGIPTGKPWYTVDKDILKLLKLAHLGILGFRKYKLYIVYVAGYFDVGNRKLVETLAQQSCVLSSPELPFLPSSTMRTPSSIQLPFLLIFKINSVGLLISSCFSFLCHFSSLLLPPPSCLSSPLAKISPFLQSRPLPPDLLMFS